MDKVQLKELKQDLANYTYDDLLHRYFANKGQIIDYNQEINRLKGELKLAKKNISKERRDQIFRLRVEIRKLKSTREALKSSVEFKEIVITKKRADLKKQINKCKADLKQVVKNCKLPQNEDFVTKCESLNKQIVDTKEQISSLKSDSKNNKAKIEQLNAKLKSLKLELKEYVRTSKEANSKSFEVVVSGLNKQILNVKKELTEFKSNTKHENRILRRQMLLKRNFNNLPDEYKQVKKLDSNDPNYSQKKKELLKPYVVKSGRVLKYQFNSLSYWLMLLVILLQIIYIITFLNKMEVNYLEFPVLIVNLVITLALFLSAMKVKVHSKFWTTVNYVFSGYLLVRIFVIIPFFAKDYPAEIDEATGQIMKAARDYSGLRMELIIFSVIMLAITLISTVMSTLRIKKRDFYYN